MADKSVKFSKLKCAPESSFWAKFSELKIDKFKLDDQINIRLWGSYSINREDYAEKPLFLDYTSFNEELETTSHKSEIACRGTMVNTNTLEMFKQVDPEKFINEKGQELLESIKSGRAIQEPWRLLQFSLLSYSDLKNYKFFFWAAHPTPYNLPEMVYEKDHTYASGEFSDNHLADLEIGFSNLDICSKSFFIVTIDNDTNILKILSLMEGISTIEKIRDKADIYFAFYDPCVHSAPGWPLRNLVCLLIHHCPCICFENPLKFISVRSKSFRNSIIYTINMKKQEEITSLMFAQGLVGWETNTRGKMGPNVVNLSHEMDPIKLSERAISLNLKLMKWRLVPGLDLEFISNLRCLLLGAGTLGCSVARILLGWNVRKITFVDNSVVSPSNTVRQSLYSYEDAVQRRPKAIAAKDSLLRIHPSLEADGIILQIPMPGHVISQSTLDTTKESLKKLEELFSTHDVVFLLLDSREARWLPTVLCAAYNKIAINAALGFDSYTVMRHGSRLITSDESPKIGNPHPSGKDLGCYFCNDVTQPGNSQIDRTLDQQCTVSRPGLSSIAGGLAVELMVALTQHPEKLEAKAWLEKNKENIQLDAGLLGEIPHTIRGSLWNYDTRLMVTHRFPSCTACSIPIINEYRIRKFDFVLNACNEPNYLEKLSGLEKILKQSDLEQLCYTFDSSEEE